MIGSTFVGTVNLFFTYAFFNIRKFFDGLCDVSSQKPIAEKQENSWDAHVSVIYYHL